MRGNTLSGVRRILKAHLGEVVADGYDNANDILYNQLISSKQTALATRFAWPFLKDRWDTVAPAESRFLTLPTLTITNITGRINTDNEVVLYTKYSNVWQELSKGIDEVDYNVLDPDQKQFQDPIEKWQYQGANQYEVWPNPASQQILRFEGYRVPDRLVSDGDILDLDDELIALFIAAERLAKSESQDAQAKFREAEFRLQELRSACSDGKPVHLGYPYNRNNRRYTVPITVASSGNGGIDGGRASGTGPGGLSGGGA